MIAGVGRTSASRWALIFVVAATAIAVSAGDADARRKKKRIGHGPPPPFSHIVLDAKTGKALEAFKADEKRYPASLTKVMTLYLLFERMDAGKLKLSTPLTISRYAASRPPSKLGLTPGSTIRVDDAIKALVTKSANDVAAVVAEAIGGSEDEFAKMMTSKARALGMGRTVYANASGLPNPRQVTTARDQAILGRAIQGRFPRQYRYFATNSFKFHGREIRTHNRLLGQVEGVDGIKTGYTHASGYNLVSSVRRDRRHIVAVVLGGSTSRGRDAFMRKLIREHIDDASPVRTAGQRLSSADADDQPQPTASAAARLSVGESETRRPARLAQGDPVDVSSHPQVTAVADADRGDVARVSPVSQTVPAAPADRVIVLADASADRIAVRSTARTDLAASLAWHELRAFPAWFPYLLVVFIGCAGSLLSACFTILPLRWRRRLPQSA